MCWSSDLLVCPTEVITAPSVLSRRRRRGKKCIGLLNTPNYHNYHNSTSLRKVKWSLMWCYVSIIEHLHGCVTLPCGSTTGPRSTHCSLGATITPRCRAFPLPFLSLSVSFCCVKTNWCPLLRDAAPRIHAAFAINPAKREKKKENSRKRGFKKRKSILDDLRKMKNELLIPLKLVLFSSMLVCVT